MIVDPNVYQRLKEEIITATTLRKVSFPIKQSPYLQACTLEGLRKFPPLSQLRKRSVPPEGDVVHGYKIPGGTLIGLNAWGTQLDSVYGEDPDAFRPERWFCQRPGTAQSNARDARPHIWARIHEVSRKSNGYDKIE